MFNSQRLPRSAVVCKRTVTRSSSSSAGAPVSNNAGRTLAAMPKSTIQTSPGVSASILVLHAIKYQSAIQRGLIAGGDVLIFLGQFQQLFTHGTPLRFREVRQFVDDLCGAHEREKISTQEWTGNG